MAKDDQADLDALYARYTTLAHAVQTGVMYQLQHDASAGSPKHLRTGLNLSKVEHGALVRLLIAKGLITEREYAEQLVAGVEDEVRMYEAELTARYGGRTKITLG